MSRLEQFILFVLDRAHKMGVKDLSRFQIFKISYLIQVLSLKYAGKEFIPNLVFIRHEHGPISTAIYDAIDELHRKRYIGKDISKKDDYAFARHGHKLIKKIPRLSFNKGEIIFLDNFLAEILPLSQNKLKQYAYATEPMKEILKKEKGDTKTGVVIDFSSVVVDPDVVNSYADEI
jgi:uncharacterized phage-associated protein